MNKNIISISLLFFCTASYGQIIYADKVFEYNPAPGQFTNVLPEYEKGDNVETMLRKCELVLKDFTVNSNGTFNPNNMICLGGYGGYIVAGFNGSIINTPDKYDFTIYGNAMDGSAGISSEPGIVMVAKDENGNGIPDDKWYEIKGSEYNNPKTIKGYSIIYKKPADDTSDIEWTDNKGNSGKINYMGQFHTQPHWPEWKNDATITFSGARLPDNAIKITSDPEYWKFTYFKFGYADNRINGTEGSMFKIEWAVDESGNSVNLDKIDFIKIYTGVNQQCGLLGESSTEICGIYGLADTGSGVITDYTTEPFICYSYGRLTIHTEERTTVYIYNMQGNIVYTTTHNGGESICSLNIDKGVYLVKAGKTTKKIIL